MSDNLGAREELRALFWRALRDDDPLAALMRLVYRVEDQWDEIDITTTGDPGGRFLHQRHLVVTIPRNAVQVSRPPIDRTVPE